MEWTELEKPTKEISTKIIIKTPIGSMMIDWINCIKNPSYNVTLNNKRIKFIGVAYNLEDAKKISVDYLENKLKELTEYMQNATNNEHT